MARRCYPLVLQINVLCVLCITMVFWGGWGRGVSPSQKTTHSLSKKAIHLPLGALGGGRPTKIFAARDTCCLFSYSHNGCADSTMNRLFPTLKGHLDGTAMNHSTCPLQPARDYFTPKLLLLFWLAHYMVVLSCM